MNEACIWQYIFLGEMGEGGGGRVWQYIFLGEVGGDLKRCWHNIRRSGYLMMMLDYKGGRGDQESGKKWLCNKWNYSSPRLHV